MNFKKEYQESFDRIKADEELKKSLLEQMNGSAVPSVRKQSLYLKGLAAVAVLLLFVGAGFFLGVYSQKESASDGNMMAESVEPENSVEGDVEIDFGDDILAGPGETGDVLELEVPEVTWYGDAEDAWKRLEIFISLMEGKELEAVRLASKDIEEESKKLRDREVDDLVAQLKNAEPSEVSGAEVMGEEFSFYRMELKDGTKIYFLITENGQFLLCDTGEVFQLNLP